MGGKVGRSLSSDKSEEASVPAVDAKQPWMHIEETKRGGATRGTKWKTTMIPVKKGELDDMTIQVFYEYAVDKAKIGSDSESSTILKKSNSGTKKKKKEKPKQIPSTSLLKEHFMTEYHLLAMAQFLKFEDLGYQEVSRIFKNMPKDDGKVGRAQFASAVKAGPDSGLLQMMVLKYKADASNGFETPEDYDYEKPTHEMYKATKTLKARENQDETISVPEGHSVFFAFYGDAERREGTNVTDIVKRLHAEGEDIRASNGMFGDPIHGTVKTLFVDVKMDGKEFNKEFERFRRKLDYNYHNLYTIERQKWQDGLIKSTVIRSFQQPSPWLVFTCGPMGVGKGHVMKWMSENGFFPMENIVHVDPDAFRMMMPEWPKYRETCGGDAGWMGQRECGMMVEIAQWAAMELNQNIWIDGSLRDAPFYAKEFENIRHKHPHYKISIMYVYATEQEVRKRIKEREEKTGRGIPEDAIIQSLGSMDKALNTLTPLCDFVARIDNNGTVPVLSAFETIDKSNNWTVVKDRFARKYDGAGEFPDFLAPVPLIPLLPEDVTHLSRPAWPQELKISFSTENSLPVDGILTPRGARAKHAIYAVMHQLMEQALGTDGLALDTSATAELTLPLQTRKLAGIPEQATHYFWTFPVERLGADEMPFQDKFAPFTQLIRNGGFCWCDAEQGIIGASAISSKREAYFLQFEHPVTVKNDVVAKMRNKRRLRSVSTPCYTQRGAIEFGWMMPNESFCVNTTLHNVGGEFGAFVYTIGDQRKRGEVKAHRFPVMAS